MSFQLTYSRKSNGICKKNCISGSLFPSSAFGKYREGYLRLSYVNSLENITESIDRMEDLIFGYRENCIKIDSGWIIARSPGYK